MGCHNAHKFLKDVMVKEAWTEGGNPEDYPESEWNRVCESCGAVAPETGINKQVFHQRLYNTTSGSPEPGDMYYNDWLPKDYYWDNHSGLYLTVILPNGREWNIDSRASNCGLPEERTHRCWVRHGEPPNITVDKNGHTCNAGAGSIWVDDYHGMLQNGQFNP
jgi:hypothetical protein